MITTLALARHLRRIFVNPASIPPAMKSLRLIVGLICSSLSFIAICAQPAAPPAASIPDQNQAAPATSPLTEALKFRSDLVASVVSGAEDSDAAIARLRTQASPSGLKLDADADFALGASDIGRRLISASKPSEAERFFQEAEKSLTTVIDRTPDKSAAEKAGYFAERANLRVHYLNKAALAKSDIDSALQLQPDSAYLRQLRVVMANGRSEVFKDTPKN